MDLTHFRVENNQQRHDYLRLQNNRLAKLRFFYLTALLLTAIGTSYIGHLGLAVAVNYIMIWGVGVTVNFIVYLVNKHNAKTVTTLRLIMVALVMMDIIIAAYVIYDQGGSTSRLTALFALPIVAAGLLFSSAMVYAAALFSGLAYATSVILADKFWVSRIDWSVALVPVLFYPVFFLILGQLVVYLSRINIRDTREEAYDAFLSLLSHQLIHPASTASSIIDVMEHQPSLAASKDKKYVNMLKSENQQLLFHLRNLLETASTIRADLVLDEVDIAETAKSVATETADRFNRQADLTVLALEPLVIKGDQGRLETALRNIIANAFEHSEVGSRVTVSAHNMNGQARITVEDHGQGISRAERRHLFEKYNLGPEKRDNFHGLGLGLFVAKKIVDAHRGGLLIESAENQGTKVIISLKLERKGAKKI